MPPARNHDMWHRDVFFGFHAEKEALFVEIQRMKCKTPLFGLGPETKGSVREKVRNFSLETSNQNKNEKAASCPAKVGRTIPSCKKMKVHPARAPRLRLFCVHFFEIRILSQFFCFALCDIVLSRMRGMALSLNPAYAGWRLVAPGIFVALHRAT